MFQLYRLIHWLVMTHEYLIYLGNTLITIVWLNSKEKETKDIKGPEIMLKCLPRVLVNYHLLQIKTPCDLLVYRMRSWYIWFLHLFNNSRLIYGILHKRKYLYSFFFFLLIHFFFLDNIIDVWQIYKNIHFIYIWYTYTR